MLKSHANKTMGDEQRHRKRKHACDWEQEQEERLSAAFDRIVSKLLRSPWIPVVSGAQTPREEFVAVLNQFVEAHQLIWSWDPAEYLVMSESAEWREICEAFLAAADAPEVVQMCGNIYEEWAALETSYLGDLDVKAAAQVPELTHFRKLLGAFKAQCECDLGDYDGKCQKFLECGANHAVVEQLGDTGAAWRYLHMDYLHSLLIKVRRADTRALLEGAAGPGGALSLRGLIPGLGDPSGCDVALSTLVVAASRRAAIGRLGTFTIGRVIRIFKDDQDNRVFECQTMVPHMREAEGLPKDPDFAAPLRTYDQRASFHGSMIRAAVYWDTDQIVAHALDVGPGDVLSREAQRVLSHIWGK
jgi:hypothetical protein